MKENTVITVSRQYGCGGRELAEILAKKLNVKLYDRQIVHIAAAKLGINDLSEQDLLELENTVHPMTLTFMPFHSFGTRMGESSRGMFLSEASVVRKLADDGPCVILGRCADYVLEDLPNHFSIFVCADDEYREKRGKDVYEGKTLKELNIENEKRARYYNYYTGKKWGEASNYDLIVNTSKVPLDKVADAIIEYINKVQG
ncbi:AAA family ATPase [uncultured Megamonas sp.]|uniref:cytidylate kinase-like family protein n=1 Tax=uncultured Megamonas sp. TaxID=286140 RepID=UPI00266FD413|nr:cytidylate kinase-like family protein [uncultured Megamonas sp.]